MDRWISDWLVMPVVGGGSEGVGIPVDGVG
jgi:hypothetical protein